MKNILLRAVRVLEDANLKLSREYGILLADQATINVTLGRPQKAEGKFKDALRVIKNTTGNKTLLRQYPNFVCKLQKSRPS